MASQESYGRGVQDFDGGTYVMDMRGQFIATTKDLIETDERVVAILGDISVFSLRKTIEQYPKRIFDIGILEQTSISMAAGLSISGLIPIFHTIAPFLVERAYEQLKLDFGYQKLGGNFITVGASFDYSSLGSTHHCPADINVLKQIPNMQIVIPGTAKEFDKLYRDEYNNGMPTYFRLSDRVNSVEQDVAFGHANVVKEGKKATILAVGPMLTPVLDAVSDLDVTVLYYTTVAPFDANALCQNYNDGPILLCEPYYLGGLSYDIHAALGGKSLRMDYIGVPHRFVNQYGTVEENMTALGMTASNIRNQLLKLLELR